VPGEREGGAHATADKSAKGRVLLLVGPDGNREQLERHLAERWDIVRPGGVAQTLPPFDLGLVDLAGFRRWQRELLAAKRREEPTFLPVVLVLSRAELRQQLKQAWQAADEFIITPVERREFSERIGLLLRARRLAVAQRAHLEYLVNYDRVTGLPNKALFMDRLGEAIRTASVLGVSLHVIAVHIPLVPILKSLGHDGMERLASIYSDRMRALLGEQSPLARLTTQAWALMLRPGAASQQVLETGARIQRIADAPVQLGGERVHVAPRIGIGIYPDDASDAAAALDCAMNALTQAKDSRPVFYSRSAQHEALRFIRTEARLHEALARGQFELWFQPQLRLRDRKVVGVEALVRWRLPDNELVPPGEFLAVAEASGLIRDVDRWVLDAACAAMQAWRAQGVGLERVAVNVSALDVAADDFADSVVTTLSRHHVPAAALELELTETALFEISDSSLQKLHRLRGLGVSVAIDDFGTGYSSLRYLHRLPISTLKVDKSFVDNIGDNETNATITRTIVSLARHFGLDTVAEGIESEDQAEFLASLDVNTGQGFLYARPMPERALRAWLSEANRS